MLKKVLKLSLGLFILGNSSFAQWSGTANETITSGNVGIGVTNPSAKLEIAQAGAATLRVGIHSNMTNTYSQFLNSLAVAGYDNQTVTSNGAVAWDFFNNGSNPSWSGTLTQHFGSAMQGSMYGLPNVGNMGVLNFQNVSNGVIGSNGANIFISPNGNLTACFLTNGNVGIGTLNPGNFKLAVEGNIAARGVNVTLANPFPDYVFESNYELRPLANLESYINQNKHLPGIPSAAEVKKDGGIELGDMNVKLLEKIEELTLYVIDLKKENEQMKKEIAAIKKKK